MLKKLKYLLLILLLPIISACVTKDISGFSQLQPNMLPTSAVTENPTKAKFVIPNAKNKTIIIWNHGTVDSWLREDCTAWFNLPPKPITDFSNDNTAVYYLCSQVTDNDKPGTYTIRRGIEINTVLDKLIKAGVKPKNIWVAGQSAGAWSTLLLPANVKKKYNGSIVFAPAAGGPKADILGNPDGDYSKMHYRQLKQFEKLPQKAIIFTFGDDRYNTKADFAGVLKAHPNTVKLYEYNCGKGHASVSKDCASEQIKSKISKFIGKN